MKRILFCFVLLLLFSCGKAFHFTTREEAAADTSYIYTLPYPKGRSHLLVQGYNSRFSHRGRKGLDFKMKTGSPITAARSGVVVAVQESNTKGGISKNQYRQANTVIIQHSDGSRALYGHLKFNGADVSVGDTVQTGQVIAHSGSTGYSAFPHLHFSVWQTDANGRRALLPTRFHTRKGVKYLKPGRWYRSQ